MARSLRRHPEQTLGARVGYRIDRFLGLHPAVQLAAVLVAAFVLAVVFGAVIWGVDLALAAPGAVCDPAQNKGACTFGDGLWWVITRMVDGGTVSNDSDVGFVHQTFGMGVTLIGLVAVTILTGAFASSFTERLHALRRGMLPVFERGHVLVLGWNAHAGVIARELGRTGERVDLVIVSDHDREVIEESLREQIDAGAEALRVVVRRGDPTTVAAVRRGAARKARAVLILPDTELGHCADRAALRSLLALERVLGEIRPRPRVIVEVASPSGHEMVRLCEAAAHDVVVVEAHEAHAQVVAQAVRQRGAFSVARQILALDALSIYLHPAGAFAGVPFDEAHAELADGILVGVARDGEPMISPGGDLVIEPADQLLVLSDRAATPAAEPTSEKLRRGRAILLPSPPDELGRPLDLLVLRHRHGLATILRFLDARGPVRATVLASPGQIAEAREALGRVTLGRTEVTLIEGDPLDRPTLDRVLEQRHDAALLLAPDVAPAYAPEADADQLISLLQLRHRDEGAPAAPHHVVVEVGNAESRLPKRLGNGDDFILSREIVGMLLAREVHAAAFGGSPVYHAVLTALGPAVELRPMDRYAGGREHPAFVDLAAAARRLGEVAIGVAEDHGPPRLLPTAGERFATKGGRLVVLRSSDTR